MRRERRRRRRRSCMLKRNVQTRVLLSLPSQLWQLPAEAWRRLLIARSINDLSIDDDQLLFCLPSLFRLLYLKVLCVFLPSTYLIFQCALRTFLLFHPCTCHFCRYWFIFTYLYIVVSPPSSSSSLSFLECIHTVLSSKNNFHVFSCVFSITVEQSIWKI